MAEEKDVKKEQAAPATPETAPAAPAAAEAVATEGAEGTKARKVRVKGGKVVPNGIVFIRATYNNTIVTVTDMRGGALSWSSAGRCGFKGARKSTAYAATVVTQEAARAAMGSVGLREVEIRVQGGGSGRESAIRAVQSAGLNVTAIKDITPLPHNGCRQRKARRV